MFILQKKLKENDIAGPKEVPWPPFRQSATLKKASPSAGGSVNMISFMHFQHQPWNEVIPPSSAAGDGENKGIEEINSISISEVSSCGG